mgnify:CR=1 FL=1
MRRRCRGRNPSPSLNGVRPRRPEQWRRGRPDERPSIRLNGVRPRRPEQSEAAKREGRTVHVSMESGLEDRNNNTTTPHHPPTKQRLNGVRPRRPEQWYDTNPALGIRLDVSMESGLEDRNNGRAGRDVLPEPPLVSMESGLEDRNNRTVQASDVGACHRLNGVRPRRPEQSCNEVS